MMSKSICRRCHRIRSVNGARYCALCAKELREQEKPRPIAVPASEPSVEMRTLVLTCDTHLSPEDLRAFNEGKLIIETKGFEIHFDGQVNVDMIHNVHVPSVEGANPPEAPSPPSPPSPPPPPDAPPTDAPGDSPQGAPV